jgi:hypothetical protein
VGRKKSKRLSVRPALWMAGASVLVCALIWTGWGVYLYWNDVRLVNFLAAWIPFVLSILLAFVPEHEMTSTKKLLWRSSVILVGLVWSIVLWHQQIVTDLVSREDSENMVANAVNKANAHSDPKIEAVQTEVKGVKTDVGGVKSDLRDTKDALSKMVSKSEYDITESLGKVGKPEPPELAKLRFSLVDEQVRDQGDNETLTIGSDGTYTVDFLVTNDSNVQAENTDIWVHLCGLCTFAKEPEGFEHPAGEPANTRHRLIGSINGGVSFKKLTINFKTTALTPNVGIAFSEACKNCGKATRTKDFTLHLNPSFRPQP